MHTPEYLAEELKQLVPWGADPKRLATKPILRALAGVDDGVPYMLAGRMVRRYLLASIAGLSNHTFMDRQLPAHDLNRAFCLILRLEGPPDADDRRYRVITKLGLPTNPVRFRTSGAEFDFLMILATHLLTGSEMAAENAQAA